MVKHTLKILLYLLQDFYVSVHFGTLCIKGLTFDSRLTPYIQESESSRVESFCAYSGTSKLNAQASQ